jgi:Nucleotidyltransferase domain
MNASDELKALAATLAGWARDRCLTIFLYGSQVRGDHRPDSDVDIHIAWSPRKHRSRVDAVVGRRERRSIRDHQCQATRTTSDGEDTSEPWKLTPSRRRQPGPIEGRLPSSVNMNLADQLYVDRKELPSAITARLIRLAAFQNPEFYRAQAMRLPTFGKPRIISCAELHTGHVGLPRGCLDEAVQLLNDQGVKITLEDHRAAGTPLRPDVRFEGKLHGPQVKAFEALASRELGVLAATTAFGKTVVAAAPSLTEHEILWFWFIAASCLPNGWSA